MDGPKRLRLQSHMQTVGLKSPSAAVHSSEHRFQGFGTLDPSCVPIKRWNKTHLLKHGEAPSKQVATSCRFSISFSVI